jgi:hypothetical protein
VWEQGGVRPAGAHCADRARVARPSVACLNHQHVARWPLDKISLQMAGIVSLVQLIRFLAVELIHPCLNSRFDTIFMANYSFSGR